MPLLLKTFHPESEKLRNRAERVEKKSNEKLKMGNCMRLRRRSRSAVAVCDPDEETRSHSSGVKTEHKAAASDHCRGEDVHEDFSEAGSGSGTEVKIKMTKKQLTELFTKVEQHGMAVGEVLAQLLESRAIAHCRGGEPEMNRQQSWRPVLQSIPEIHQLK